MQEIDFAQLEKQEQQQRQQQQQRKAEKAAITVTYELPQFDEKIADDKAITMSVDISFSVNVRPAQF